MALHPKRDPDCDFGGEGVLNVTCLMDDEMRLPGLTLVRLCLRQQPLLKVAQGFVSLPSVKPNSDCCL